MAPREQRGQSPAFPSSSLCQLEGQLPAENRVAWPLCRCSQTPNLMKAGVDQEALRDDRRDFLKG